MKFDSKISIVPHLFRSGNMNLQGFLIAPIKEVKDVAVGNVSSSNIEECSPDEAEAYGLYALVNSNEKPKAVVREWIADFPTEGEAEILKLVIEQLISCSKPARALYDLLYTLEEQLTEDAKENVSTQEAMLAGEAALNGWVQLSNGIYFDKPTGNTYGTERENPVHIDDVEFSEWFDNLKPGDMVMLEEYWQGRKATQIPGFMAALAANVLNMPPAQYPYRWYGENFQICYNGTWKDAEVKEWVLPGSAFPEEELKMATTDGSEIPLEAVRSGSYAANVKKYGNGENTCLLCGKRTDGNLHVHLLTDGNLSNKSDSDVTNSQGCFPIGPDCAKKLPSSYIFPLPPIPTKG